MNRTKHCPTCGKETEQKYIGNVSETVMFSTKVGNKLDKEGKERKDRAEISRASLFVTNLFACTECQMVLAQ